MNDTPPVQPPEKGAHLEASDSQGRNPFPLPPSPPVEGSSTDVLQQILDIGTRLVGARFGAMGVLNETGDKIVQFLTSGIDEETREKIGPPPKGEGILGVLFQTPRPLRVSDLGQDPRSVGFPENHPPMRSFLGVPLRWKDRIYGNFYFTEKRAEDEFSPEDERLAESFAELAVGAIEREKNQEEAKQARDFFRSIVDNNADAITITNAGREIIFCNEAAQNLFGYAEEEILGQNIGIIVPPEMRHEWTHIFEPKIAALFRFGHPYRFESVRIRKDGKRVPVSVTLSPVRGRNGETIAISGVTKDLTEAKRVEEHLRASESRYRNILENVQLISVGLDLVGNITFCNDFLLDLTGWKNEEVIGSDWFDTFVPSDVREEVRQMFLKNTTQETIERSFQNEIITRAGGRRLISWNNTILHDSEGNVAGTISIGEDITVRKQAEDRAIQNQKLEALGRLSSGVAHDFNNALGIIHGGAEVLERILLRSGTDADTLEYLDIIRKSAMSAAHTVKRLQDFARKREDRPLGHADVNHVIRDAAEMTKPRWQSEAETQGITIEMALRPYAANSVVDGEETELQEILINLIINALDAMPEGGRITISSKDTPEGPRVSVRDTGAGMLPEVRERAFEPFFSTKGEEGTGMGLSMVFGIVKRYGGTIDIESTEGTGTTVSFTLPSSEYRKPTAPAKAESIGGTARILLVEDEANMARILRALLEEAGYSIKIARSGAEAIESFKGSYFDLLIIDLGLPDMTGTDAAREIKSGSPETPVILLTGWQTEMTSGKMAEAGLDLVVGKPVRKEELYRAVAGILTGRGEA